MNHQLLEINLKLVRPMNFLKLFVENYIFIKFIFLYLISYYYILLKSI